MGARGEDGEYISHYDIDNTIQEKFPVVTCDSESGQGWCYAPKCLVSDILELIKPMVESSKSYPNNDCWQFNWETVENEKAE